jgi:hypothetical protein
MPPIANLQRPTTCLTCRRKVVLVCSPVTDADGIFEVDESGHLAPHACPVEAVIEFYLARRQVERRHSSDGEEVGP